MSDGDETPANGLLGNIERHDRQRIEGWAFDVNRPDEPVELGIYCNGELIGRMRADRHRPDLEAVGYLGRGRCSFICGLPLVRPLIRYVLEVRRLSDGAPLPGSPLVWEAATRLDADTRQDIADIVQATALSANEPTELDDIALFLMQQVDRLLSARAKLIDGDRGTVVTLEQRWGSFIPTKAAAAAAPSIHPQALFLDTYFPTCGDSAGSNAVLDHMRALRRLGFQIRFAALHELDDPRGGAAQLERYEITSLTKPWYGSIEEILQRHGSNIDLVYMHRVSATVPYIKLSRLYCPNAVIVYSVGDLHHLRVERQSAVFKRSDLEQRARLLLADELSAANGADLVITHSPVEAELLRHQLPNANVSVIPWAVPLRHPSPDAVARQGVAFIGNFSHEPNQDALHFLCSSIIPWVRRYAPEIQFRVYGSNMPAKMRKITQNNLEIMGYAENLDEIYRSVRLTVAPLRFGAGIKGKVLESLAAGVPCIGTTIAYEGIDVPESLTDCVVKNAQEFCNALTRLYHDQRIYRAASIAGQRYASITYSEAVIDTRFWELLRPMMRCWAIPIPIA